MTTHQRRFLVLILHQLNPYGMPKSPPKGPWPAKTKLVKVPPNCSFQIDDVEMSWALGAQGFDLIHARDLLLSIRDWPEVVEQSFEHADILTWQYYSD